ELALASSLSRTRSNLVKVLPVIDTVPHMFLRLVENRNAPERMQILVVDAFLPFVAKNGQSGIERRILGHDPWHRARTIRQTACFFAGRTIRDPLMRGNCVKGPGTSER